MNQELESSFTSSASIFLLISPFLSQQLAPAFGPFEREPQTHADDREQQGHAVGAAELALFERVVDERGRGLVWPEMLPPSTSTAPNSPSERATVINSP